MGGGANLCGGDQMFVDRIFSKNGHGLDDKNRYDFFISETRVALFQDGELIVQSAIPAGTFPWANVPLRAYYSHYVYHSDNDDDDLMQYNNAGQTMCYPLNSYWFNHPQLGTSAGASVCNIAYPAGYGFPYSDERHWDNMGFEVLPANEASNDYSVFSPLVQLPPMVPGGPAGPVPTAPSNVRVIR